MTYFKYVLILICLSLVSGCIPKDRTNSNPNIILILADDLGIGDLGCYGQNTLNTPNIDEMAKEGILFTNHYAGSTVCAPSRACLLTGKHTGHSSVRGNEFGQSLSNEEITIAKVLKNAGYVTAAIGKWGVGHPLPVDDPMSKGFDFFYGYINMWHAHNYYPEFLYRNGKKLELNNKLRKINGQNPWSRFPEGTGVAEKRNEYVHYLFDEQALSFIEQNKESNFFLYLAYNAPHANNENKENGMEVPSFGKFAENEWPDSEKGFATMIQNIDNSVGMVMMKLKELEIDEKTIIFFCSDNGPHQEGGHLAEYFNSNGEYRGIKRDLYEGGIRTSFIVRWPGKIKANQTTDHVSAFWDVLPTFCDLIDTDIPQGIDGISFLPSLMNQNHLQKKHPYLYWEFYEDGGKQAVIEGKWKAVRKHVLDTVNPSYTELYNLELDLHEEKDLAAQYPDVLNELEKVFIKEHEKRTTHF